jgi:hypothetical protein
MVQSTCTATEASDEHQRGQQYIARYSERATYPSKLHRYKDRQHSESSFQSPSLPKAIASLLDVVALCVRRMYCVRTEDQRPYMVASVPRPCLAYQAHQIESITRCLA